MLGTVTSDLKLSQVISSQEVGDTLRDLAVKLHRKVDPLLATAADKDRFLHTPVSLLCQTLRYTFQQSDKTLHTVSWHRATQHAIYEASTLLNVLALMSGEVMSAAVDTDCLNTGAWLIKCCCCWFRSYEVRLGLLPLAPAVSGD